MKQQSSALRFAVEIRIGFLFAPPELRFCLAHLALFAAPILARAAALINGVVCGHSVLDGHHGQSLQTGNCFFDAGALAPKFVQDTFGSLQESEGLIN